MPVAARLGAVSQRKILSRVPGYNPTPIVEPPGPPAVPDAPVLQGAAGDGQNVLSWTEPDAHNAAITGYTLERSQPLDWVNDTDAVIATEQTSMTFSHTVPTGSNRLLVVALTHRSSVALRTVTGVTFGGVALTQLTHDERSARNFGTELWYLIAPAVSTANVVITMSNTAGVAACALDFTGAHQTVPFGTPVTENGSASNPAVDVSSAVGEIVVDSFAGPTVGAAGVGAGQSEKANQAAGPTFVVRHGVSLEDGAATVTMSWVRDTDDYAIVAAPIKPAAAGTTVYSALSPRTFTDTGLANGTPTDYRVKATNSEGDSAWSNTVTLTPTAPTPPTSAPSAPVLSGTAGDGLNTLAWVVADDGGAPVTSYELQDGGVAIASGLSTGYVHEPLVNDVAHVYRVNATNTVGTSEWSNELTLTPTAPPVTTTKPDAPVLSGTPGDTQNSLTWTTPFDGNDPITSYELQRDAVEILDQLTNGTTDTGRTNGVTYTYRVRAVNATGASDWSNTLNLTPVGAASVPDPPVLSGSAGDGTVSLSWTTPFSGGSAILSYELYWGFTLKQDALSPRTFTDSPVPNGTERTYWVRAKNAIGYSGPSNLIKVTPTSTGAGPALPADAVVGKAASDFTYLGDWQTGMAPATQVPGWRTNLGFNQVAVRLGGGNGIYGYSNPYRLRVGTVLVPPYNSDTSYTFQASWETAGPFKAKANGEPIKVFIYLKLHKVRDNTYTAPGVGGDLGPFGGDWWDDNHWAQVCDSFRTNVFEGAEWLGCDGFHLDPEFGTWDYPPTGGHTVAEQKAKIEQRGYEWGRTMWQVNPDFWCGHYGMPMLGGFHEEVGIKNRQAGDGAYFHTPGPAGEDPPGRFPNPSLPYHQDQDYQGWQHHQFYRGVWRAAADFAGPNARWTFRDAFWYHASTQYSGVSLDLALRWNLWGIFSWLSRDTQLSAKTRNWIMTHLYVEGTAWAGTDQGNGYYDTQLAEPAYTNLLKSLRIWGMAGKSEYSYGMGHPSDVAPGGAYQPPPPYSQSIYNRHLFGRPNSGRIWGLNLYTGAAGAGTSFTGVLGGSPVGGGSGGTYNAGTQSGSGGQQITYGATSSTPATPVDFSLRIAASNLSTRPSNMLAACSTTPVSSAVPTFTVAPVATRVNNGNVTVTCRVTHPHAIWHVTVHKGSTFNPANPTASIVGVMAMTFEPNNGTNLPPAGLSNPYMQCTFTSTGGGWAVGDWVVVGAKSTKEDTAWRKVQVTT